VLKVQRYGVQGSTFRGLLGSEFEVLGSEVHGFKTVDW